MERRFRIIRGYESEAEMTTQQKAGLTPSFTLMSAGAVQRKCACGEHTIAGGECGNCNKDRQTLQRATRKPEHENRDFGGVPPIVYEALRTPGQPLDAAT